MNILKRHKNRWNVLRTFHKPYEPINAISLLTLEMLFAVLNILTIGIFIHMIFSGQEYKFSGQKVHYYTLIILIPALIISSIKGIWISKCITIPCKLNKNSIPTKIIYLCVTNLLADYILLKLNMNYLNYDIVLAKILFSPFLIILNLLLLKQCLGTKKK
jgi:hypothetical protein